MLNKFNFSICFLIVLWFGTCIAQLDPIRLDATDKTDNQVNLTEKYNKCLRPLQILEKDKNISLDGLTNCTCQDGFEFDQVFGVSDYNL